MKRHLRKGRAAKHRRQLRAALGNFLRAIVQAARAHKHGLGNAKDRNGRE